MPRPRVSWLLPVRDGGRWLAACVASVLADSGPEDELLVIDDGSVDEPQALLPADPRLRLLRQPALGIATALEHGRREARSPWLARIDADDEVLPGRLDAQLARLEADPRLAALGGRAELVGDGDHEVPEGMRRYVDWVNGLEDLHRELLVESPLFHPAVTLRAAAIAEVGGWRDGDLPEDYDLWLRLRRAGWSLASLPRVVVRLRDRPGRLTRTDPRYRRKAFEALKLDHASAVLLPGKRRVVIWGAGRGGRPWLRRVLEAGADVPMVIDRFVQGERRGRPVRSPEALVGLDLDLLLVAVGARGARARIRAELSQLRPDLVEGRDWWAVC
jgi:glycosyltransferase involved in cell wall biosynthesis